MQFITSAHIELLLSNTPQSNLLLTRTVLLFLSVYSHPLSSRFLSSLSLPSIFHLSRYLPSLFSLPPLIPFCPLPSQQQVSSAHVVDTESIVENGIAPKGGCADSVTVEFTLPAGSYATAYFREIMKNNHFI